MGKIKILYLIDFYYEFGGAERNLFDVVKHINKDNFTPFVFALKTGKRFEEFAKAGIYSKSLNIDRIYNLEGIKSIIDLIRFIKKEKIDIIISYHESSDMLAALLGITTQVKAIVSSRRDLGYSLKKRHILIYRLINKFFTRIITVSNAVKEVICTRERVSKEKIITIYNGVDLNRTNYSEGYSDNELKTLGINRNKMKIGMLASYRKIKGIEYFIKAAKLVKKNRNDLQFLVVGKIGEGKNEYLEELMDLSDNTVKFVDFQKDISKIINLLDVVVLPSLSEGFSNTLIEAMAAGKPVVATNVGGNPEAVIEGGTGFLVPPANETALADAMIKIIQSEELRTKLGANGKARANIEFNLQRMIRINEIIYAHLIDIPQHKPFFLPALKRIIKYSIATIVYYSGLLKIISQIKKRSGRVLILAYHNIVQKSDNYLNLDVSVESFIKQLQVINKYFKIIPLSEGIEILKGKKVKGNYLCLTFDDGYKGIHQYLMPLLMRQNIPITIFLTSSILEESRILWFDELIFVISNTKVQALDLQKQGLGTFLLNSISERINACNNIADKLKKYNTEQIKTVINDIKLKLEIEMLPKPKEYYLTKENIQQLLKHNVSVGSHTVTHSILTKLGPEDLDYELRHSRECIGKIINKDIEFIAYPNGEKNDFNDEVIAGIELAGYKGAFTLIKNRCILPYQVGRFGIYEHGKYNPSVFAFDVIRNICH